MVLKSFVMNEVQKVGIVGSGLVGTVLAIGLKKMGYEVDVIDRSSDIRMIDFSGRSINLALSTRGWNALDKVGIGDEVREISIPMNKRAIHKIDSSTVEQQYGVHGESICSVSRGGLNQKLVALAEEVGVNFIFDCPIFDIDLKEAVLYTGENEMSSWDAMPYDIVFGADGAYSKIRARMQRQSRFEYSQHYLNIGYKELTIDADEFSKHKLDSNSFHIWPRGNFMLIALPNLDGSFTCTIFMPFEGDISFEAIQTEVDLGVFFETYFKDAAPLIMSLKKDFFTNPTNSLVTTTCYPWVANDKVALIGDAAHAVVPFYGQGLNAGLEDVSELLDLLSKYPKDWATCLEKYQISRKPNADAIAELSDRNFIEMSTLTADPNFLLQKKIEKRFTDLYPNYWLPLYDRVTFSSGSYAEALKLGDFQSSIMEEIMSLDNISEKWDSKEVENMMLRHF